MREKHFQNPASTVDLILENKNSEILLIKRKYNPFQGYWALPGGHLDYGQETLEQAGIRELEEETHLKAELENLKLIGIYSEPNRDPRGHVISHAYFVKNYSGILKADDDAQDSQWFHKDNLPRLAFDHERILNDYEKLRRLGELKNVQ